MLVLVIVIVIVIGVIGEWWKGKQHRSSTQCDDIRDSTIGSEVGRLTEYQLSSQQTPSVMRSPASFAEQNVAGNLRSLMKQSLLSKR